MSKLLIGKAIVAMEPYCTPGGEIAPSTSGPPASTEDPTEVTIISCAASITGNFILPVLPDFA